MPKMMSNVFNFNLATSALLLFLPNSSPKVVACLLSIPEFHGRRQIDSRMGTQLGIFWERIRLITISPPTTTNLFFVAAQYHRRLLAAALEQQRQASSLTLKAMSGRDFGGRGRGGRSPGRGGRYVIQHTDIQIGLVF